MPSACPSVRSPMTSLLLQSPCPSERLKSKLNNDIQREARGCFSSRSSSPRTIPGSGQDAPSSLRVKCGLRQAGRQTCHRPWPENRGGPDTQQESGRLEAWDPGLALSLTGRCPPHSGPQFPHCAMRGGASTLGPVILIWPSPTLALGGPPFSLSPIVRKCLTISLPQRFTSNTVVGKVSDIFKCRQCFSFFLKYISTILFFFQQIIYI